MTQKKTSPSRKNKDNQFLFAPVELKLGSRILAVASVKKKPSKRCPDPYWNMRIRTQDKSERIIINLGRYPRTQVLDIMFEAYQEYKGGNQPISKSASSKSASSKSASSKSASSKSAYRLEILLDEWYEKYVSARSPKSGIRTEFQLSRFTIRGYHTCINQLKRYGGDIDLSVWTIGDFEDLKISLQQKYAPRTVHLIISVLKRVIQWAEKRNKPIQKVEFENKKPPRSQHVRNERTPIETEAQKIFDSVRSCTFKIIYLLCGFVARIKFLDRVLLISSNFKQQGWIYIVHFQEICLGYCIQ